MKAYKKPKPEIINLTKPGSKCLRFKVINPDPLVCDECGAELIEFRNAYYCHKCDTVSEKVD